MRRNELNFKLTASWIVAASLCFNTIIQGVHGYSMISITPQLGYVIVPKTKTGSGITISGEFKTIIIPSHIVLGLGIDYLDFQAKKDTEKSYIDGEDTITYESHMVDVYGQGGLCLVNSGQVVIDLYSILGINLIRGEQTTKSDDTSSTSESTNAELLYGVGVGIDIFPLENKAITLDVFYINTHRKRIGAFGFKLGFAFYHLGF